MAESAETAPRPTADEVGAWVGNRLDEIAGIDVGRIEGAFVDQDGGEPEWLLARMGRFGHYTLVPVRDAVEGVGHVWVPFTRDQIRGAPKVDPRAGLTATAERALFDHYGIAVDAGRAAELGEREDDAITARPLNS